jgi:hypothetical protein
MVLTSLAALLPAAVAAQPLERCHERFRRAGAAASLTAFTSQMLLDSDMARINADEEYEIGGRKLGLAVDGHVPLAGRWALRVYAARTWLGVDRIRRARRSPFDVIDRRGDEGAIMERLHLGGIKSLGQGRRVCGYSGISAGINRIEYRGVAVARPAVAGLLGFEMVRSRSRSIALEFQFDVVGHDGRPPLLNEAILGLGVALGYRHRF